MDATAYLAYGVDIGADRPKGLPADYETVYDWTRNSQISRFVRRVRYFCEDEIILAVQGTVRSADGSPKVVSGFEVDADKVEGFKAALKSIGIDNPEPKWLLAFEMNF